MYVRAGSLRCERLAAGGGVRMAHPCMGLAEHDTGKAKLTAFLTHYVYVCMYEQTEAARASTLNRRRHLPSKAQGQTMVNYVFEQHAGHLFIHASFPLSPHPRYKINKQGKLEN